MAVGGDTCVMIGSTALPGAPSAGTAVTTGASMVVVGVGTETVPAASVVVVAVDSAGLVSFAQAEKIAIEQKARIDGSNFKFMSFNLENKGKSIKTKVLAHATFFMILKTLIILNLKQEIAHIVHISGCQKHV